MSTEKLNEDVAVDAIEEVKVTPGQRINWLELFRVKGRQGLYTMRSTINASGICGVMRFFRPDECYTASVKNMVCLGELVFITYQGHDDLSMADVFDNLFDLEEGGVDLAKMLENDIEELMDKAVPEYDAEEFRRSHMKLCLDWYREVRDKVDEVGGMMEERDGAENDSETKTGGEDVEVDSE